MNVDYDFPVRTEPIHLQNGTVISGAKAIVRTDTEKAISVVSDRYKLFTHRQAVESTEPFLKRFGDYKSTNVLERDGARFVHECTFGKSELAIEGSVHSKKVGDAVVLTLSVINSYDALRSLIVKIGAKVLRCLNGMTVEKGRLELAFKHTAGIVNFELPDPSVVLNLFQEAGRDWNKMASTEVTEEHVEFITGEALKLHVVSKRLLDTYEGSFYPALGRLSFWDYHNNFTEILTHHLPKVQHTRKLERLDRLNAVFTRAIGNQMTGELETH